MADQARAVTGKAREEAGRATQSARGVLGRIQQHSPSSRQMLALVAVLVAGAVALVLAGVTLAGGTITFLLASPLLLFFSPLLVPLAIIVALCTGGFVTASGVFLAVCSAASWAYNYAKGRHPVGADSIDAVKDRIADAATQVTEKARDAGAMIQAKVASGA